MRIIAGEFKGRKLETPVDKLVRPTTDKVKEALFSILAPNIYDAVVCDPFSGTGNLGLEAISRGAKFCWFGDHAGESIKLIKDNVEKCKVEDRCEIVHGNYTRTFDNITELIDIFFLDPPYKKTLLEESIEMIADKKLLAKGGIIIAEHHRDKIMPNTLYGFEKIKEKRYSRVVLSIYM